LNDEIEKKNFNYIKGLKKIAINIMMIKIEKQNKFYIWLKDKIEKKNQFSKRKKIKEWGQSWNKR
jgi:hypothetical protein